MSKCYRFNFALLAGFGLAVLALRMLSGAQARSEQPEASIVVNTLEDEYNTDGDCSLREAISAASTNASIDACPKGNGELTDTITFAVNGRINITSQLEGFGSGPLVIDGGGTITIDAGGHSRIVSVESGADLTLKNLLLTHGRVSAPVNGGSALGGGIYNLGNLKIFNCTITSNSTSGFSSYGAGILNMGIGKLLIQNSTISNNRANQACYKGICGGAHGGGISNFLGVGGITLINDTIINNWAYNSGGGVYMSGGQIINSTISGNSTNYSGGGVAGVMTIKNSTIVYNTHGGIGGGARAINTIIAGNSYRNCSTKITDLGHNIDSGNTCGLDPAIGSLPNTQPQLGPLQDNGGPTWTYALQPGSPAIDAGDDAACPSTDQRGVSRPIDGDLDGDAICDVGSYEFEPGGNPIETFTTINSDDPDPSSPGQPVTVTYAVTSSTGIPTGLVAVWFSYKWPGCIGGLESGLGSCTLVFPQPGEYALIATYSGDELYRTSNDDDIHTVIGSRLYVPMITK